jgi:hypothetical protein
VIGRSPFGRAQWKQVSLLALVADLAGEKQIRPFIGEPPVARDMHRLLLRLRPPVLGAEMLNVSVGHVDELRLAEGALVVLRLPERGFDGWVAVDAWVEREPQLTAEVVRTVSLVELLKGLTCICTSTAKHRWRLRRTTNPDQ